MTIEKRISDLPEEAQTEIYDFIDFIILKYKKIESDYWLKLSEKSLEKVWDNDEDDVYNELL